MNIKTMLKLLGSGEVQQKGSSFGSGLVNQEIHQMIAQGMGRIAVVGAFSTPGAGGGVANVIDLDQPRLAVAIPGGVVIRPLFCHCQVQPGLIAADNDENEILLGVDVLGMWTGDGTSTAEQPVNMRSDLGRGSVCRVGSTFSGNMTTTNAAGTAAAPVVDMELERMVEHVDVSTGVSVNVHQLMMKYQPEYPPLIAGPATLLLYYGGTVALVGGFAQVGWLEGRSEDFYVRT